MVIQLLLAAAVALPADTLRLTADEALARGAAALGAPRAAALRAQGARRQAAAAGAWRNPRLSAVAENLGAEREITGRDGLAGVEGQVTLDWLWTLGGERGARRREALALADAADADARLADGDARVRTIELLAAADRELALAAEARAEAAALAGFAAAMARRAAEGRSSGGDAARVALEAATARAGAARRAAAAAAAVAERAWLLGVDADVPVVVEPGACAAAPAPSAAVAEVERAEAAAAAAAAAADFARALRVPDVAPIVGWRRTAGFSGLLLGLSVDLPLFQSGGAGAAAARLAAEAARVERDAVAAATDARRAGARAGLAALDDALPAFDAGWDGALDRVLRSAQSSYDQGEGTLAALLDARRARLAAIEARETWRAERRVLRARAARLDGRPVDGTLFCEETR